MATVRNCSKCGRPSGPKFTQCMYCGTQLPALATATGSEVPAVQVDVMAEGEKARRLLEGLSPQARSMMPQEVIAKLEAQVAAAQETARTERMETITASISLPDLTTPPAPEPPKAESAFDVPEPSPEGDPSIPDIGSLDIEAFDVASISHVDLEPYVSQRVPAMPGLAPPPRVDSADALIDGLTRGGGPFGRREAAARMILLPDPSYKGQAHWLRHRLAQTMETDLYTAGQALQRDVPACIGVADSFEEAEAKVDHLRSAGLKVLTIERDGWLEDALPEAVREVALDGAEAVFARLDGTTFRVPRADFTWAALGDIQHDTAKVPMVPERNRWGTAQQPEGRSLDLGGGAFLVLDLLRRSSRRPIRVRSDEFDFSCLGEQRGLAAGLNLRTLLKWLSPSPDQAIELNDRFKRVSHVPGVPPSQDKDTGRLLSRRELEFTEFVLLTDAEFHL